MRSSSIWCRRHVRRRADLLEHRASGLELGPVAQGSAIVLRIGGRALGLRQAVDDADRGATPVDGVTLEAAERAVVYAPALHPALVEAEIGREPDRTPATHAPLVCSH